MRWFTSNSSFARNLSRPWLGAWLTGLLACLVSWDQLLACAVCSGEEKESVRQAYSYSTGWLSLIPVLFMGGVIYFIYRRVKRGNSEE